MPQVLVLNSDLRPLLTIDWQRAISLVLTNKVDLLHVYEDRPIRSPSFSMKMPSVIRVKKWVKTRPANLRFNKENVFIRDNYICQYCLAQLKEGQATLDHVTPKSRGGETNWKNAATCCVPCNQRKGNRTPQEARMTLVRQPFAPKGLAIQDVLGITEENNVPSIWRYYTNV